MVTRLDMDYTGNPYVSVDGEFVSYEDYQKLEVEVAFLRENNDTLFNRIQDLVRELYPPEEWERIDDTPPNEIVYPWGLYSEEKDG